MNKITSLLITAVAMAAGAALVSFQNYLDQWRIQRMVDDAVDAKIAREGFTPPPRSPRKTRNSRRRRTQNEDTGHDESDS